jgi:sortase A
VAGIGRTLITLGLLILLFVAYQLWGTDIYTARAQEKLKHELNTLTNDVKNETTTSTTPPTTTHTSNASAPKNTTTTTTTAPATIELPPLKEGDPLGRIIIPKIGVNWIFVEGTNRDDLAKGPGHYTGTPFPGQIGNAAIAGHRTTHGAPFYNVDQLQPRTATHPGDYIVTQTLIGQHVFEVIDSRIVKPSDTWVAGPMSLPEQQLNHIGEALSPNNAYLTLTSCNPRFSARERIVILAELINPKQEPKSVPKSQPAVAKVNYPGETNTESPKSLSEGLSGDVSSRAPALVWGIIALIGGALWWWAFRRFRHPATWLVGVVPFMLVLFVFYVYLERMLPANY